MLLLLLLYAITDFDARMVRQDERKKGRRITPRQQRRHNFEHLIHKAPWKYLAKEATEHEIILSTLVPRTPFIVVWETMRNPDIRNSMVKSAC